MRSCYSGSMTCSQTVLNQNTTYISSNANVITPYIKSGFLQFILGSTHFTFSSEFDDFRKSSTGIMFKDAGYNASRYTSPKEGLSMALLNEKYLSAHKALDEIAALKYNWNENGAEPFPYDLIYKCRKILDALSKEPFISPTACGSIQFEYEKDDDDYLEFEIFNDKIKVYSSTVEGGEKEYILNGVSASDEMKQLVVDFCE